MSWASRSAVASPSAVVSSSVQLLHAATTQLLLCSQLVPGTAQKHALAGWPPKPCLTPVCAGSIEYGTPRRRRPCGLVCRSMAWGHGSASAPTQISMCLREWRPGVTNSNQGCQGQQGGQGRAHDRLRTQAGGQLSAQLGFPGSRSVACVGAKPLSSCQQQSPTHPCTLPLPPPLPPPPPPLLQSPHWRAAERQVAQPCQIQAHQRR